MLGFDTQLPQDACHLPVQVIKPRLSLQCIFLYLHGPIDPRRLGDTTTMMAVVQLSSIVVPFTLINRIQTGISQVDPEVFILQCWVGRTSLGPLSLSQVPDMIGLSNIHRCQVGLGEITWRKNKRRQSFLAALFSTVRLFETDPRPPIQSYNGLAINHRRSPARSGSSLFLCSIDRFDETIFPRDQDDPDFIPANLGPPHRRRHHGNRPNPQPPAALLWYMSVVLMEQRPPGGVYTWATSSFWGITFGLAFRLHCHIWFPPLFLRRPTCHRQLSPRQSTHGHPATSKHITS